MNNNVGKILCKYSFKDCYIKGKWYDIVFSYVGLGVDVIGDNDEVHGLYFRRRDDYGYLYIWDYFYTEQEIRKLKLERIENESRR